MNTARMKMKSALSTTAAQHSPRRWRMAFVSLFLLAGLSGPALAAESGDAAAAPVAATAPASDAPATPALITGSQPAASSAQPVIPQDLSVLGMYHHADAVVKTVMIGLLLASVVTWAILFAKGSELFAAKRRLRRELSALAPATSLNEAAAIVENFDEKSISARLLADAQNELALSAESTDNAGIKDRTGFRLERRVAAAGRHMGRGNGFLATIGAISPFIGLFGTVWGIMNSFIGIAETQTTNLAVVAPGIAEALLATAIGLVAAIPAVVIYNIFARLIASYRHLIGDVAAQIMLLQGRDLDLAASAGSKPAKANPQWRVG